MFHEQRLIFRIEVPDNQTEFIENTDQELLGILGEQVEETASIDSNLASLQGRNEQRDRALVGRYKMVNDSYEYFQQYETNDNSGSISTPSQIEDNRVEALRNATNVFYGQEPETIPNIGGIRYTMHPQEKFILFNLLREFIYNDVADLIEAVCERNEHGQLEIRAEKLLGAYDSYSVYRQLGFRFDENGNSSNFLTDSRARWIYRDHEEIFDGTRSTRTNWLDWWTGGSSGNQDENSGNSPEGDLQHNMRERELRVGADISDADYYEFVSGLYDIEAADYYTTIENIDSFPEEIRNANVHTLVTTLYDDSNAQSEDGLIFGQNAELITLANGLGDIDGFSDLVNSMVWSRESAEGERLLIIKNPELDTFRVVKITENDDGQYQVAENTQLSINDAEAEPIFALIAQGLTNSAVETYLQDRILLIPPENIDLEESLSNMETEVPVRIQAEDGFYIEYDKENPSQGRQNIFDAILRSLRSGESPDSVLENVRNLTPEQQEEELRFIAEYLTDNTIEQISGPDSPEVLIFRADLTVQKNENDEVTVDIELDTGDTQDEINQERRNIDRQNYREERKNMYLTAINSAIQGNMILNFLVDDPETLAINLAASGRDIESINSSSIMMIAAGASSMVAGFVGGIPFVGNFLRRMLGQNKTLEDIELPPELAESLEEGEAATREIIDGLRSPRQLNSSNWVPSSDPLPENRNEIDSQFVEFESNVPMATNSSLYLSPQTRIIGDISGIQFFNDSGNEVTLTPVTGTDNEYRINVNLTVQDATWQQGTRIDGRIYYGLQEPEQPETTTD